LHCAPGSVALNVSLLPLRRLISSGTMQLFKFVADMRYAAPR